MKSGLVSVILPIYKVEPHLDKCITSIVNQTYANLEIILVDDGSPDNCPQICDEWAKRDSRIRVIHKVNAGLGRARNTGLEHASGEYICFFDSDDYIELETIELAYQMAMQHDADLVCFGMNIFNAEGVKIGEQIPKAPPNMYVAEDVCGTFLPRLIGPDPKTGENFEFAKSAWSNLYSMRSIRKNHWRFVSEREISSEDYYSIVALCADIEKVCVLPVACYNYCLHNVSVSRSYRKDRFQQVCHFYSEIIKLCRKCNYGEEVEYRLGGTYLSLVIAAMKQEVAFGETFKSKKDMLRGALSYGELQRVLEESKNDKVGIKKKILFWAMRHRLVNVCYVLLLAQNTVS